MKRPDPATLRWVASVLQRIARQMDDYQITQGAEGVREVADWLDHQAKESDKCQTTRTAASSN
jgi:hypothetical protein